MKKAIIFILFALGICLSAYGFESEPSWGGLVFCRHDTVDIHVRYRRGSAAIDTLYLDNKASLDSLVSILGRLASEPQSGVTISLKGSASPEGTLKINNKLAEKRAASLRDYILANTALPASAVTIEESGIDWQSLKDMVAATDQPWRDEAVSIITEIPVFIYDSDNKIVDGRNNRLGMLHGGRAWRYMEDHFFSGLRNAGVLLAFPAEDAGQPEEACAETGVTGPEPGTDDMEASGGNGTGNGPAGDKAAGIAESAASEAENQENQATEALPGESVRRETGVTGRRPLFLLKTNMLYDIAAVPNIGVEIPVGKHWSVGADWMSAWWSKDSRHRYWRVYGGDLEVRRWFPARADAGMSLSGHHLGLYGQMLTYDFEWGGKGQLGDRWSWGAGLSYGYSLPIGKYFNIDFTVGAGYLQGEYMEYHPEDGCYVWDSTHIRKWFGPTKAEISLVWFIGGKGGRR